MENKIVIDASGCVMGRLASFMAQQALRGKEVIVVNCNDAVITGSVSGIQEKYVTLRQKGGSSLRGPRIIRIPEKIVKRTARGMLPHKKGMGSLALKRIMCYNGVPAEFSAVEKVSPKKPLKVKAITLKEICKII